ncbi:MAG: zinc-binding alcohol dehydrogenase family protein, partial [Hyphomonadaceae bacterium]
MRAMSLVTRGAPLEMREREDPVPGAHEVLLRVRACGVCRTDLHIADGELPTPRLPVTPGHEIVGVVERKGQAVDHAVGARLGAPWLAYACGVCHYCQTGRENLCDASEFTGWTRDGGYADKALVDARFCIPIPDEFSDAEAAPLLCAGLIGFRSWRMAGSPDTVRNLGLYGFGAAAHLLAQVAIAHGQAVYAFTRPGDTAAQAFARGLGCAWADGSDTLPPSPLDAAILFAPVGALVPAALTAVRKGGTVVCGGIHMSDIPSFPYNLLWEE